MYKDVWNPFVGETLLCRPEFGNLTDPYAVTCNRPDTVGHLPRKISAMCHLFLRQNGNILCQITGNRRYSVDLEQGGLEVPCCLTFVGNTKLISKVERLLTLATSNCEERPPIKKLKVFDIESDDTHADKPQIWMRYDNYILTTSDEEAITMEHKLNDRHINFAKKLLLK